MEEDFWSKEGSPAPSGVNCSSFFNSYHSVVVSIMDLGCKNIVNAVACCCISITPSTRWSKNHHSNIVVSCRKVQTLFPVA